MKIYRSGYIVPGIHVSRYSCILFILFILFHLCILLPPHAQKSGRNCIGASSCNLREKNLLIQISKYPNTYIHIQISISSKIPSRNNIEPTIVPNWDKPLVYGIGIAIANAMPREEDNGVKWEKKDA